MKCGDPHCLAAAEQKIKNQEGQSNMMKFSRGSVRGAILDLR
jgi:hypothetical protein